jgi:hypothetical protein
MSTPRPHSCIARLGISDERIFMKRLTLILGAAAAVAISAPVSSATAQGCSWWDVACRGLTNTVRDGGWHIAGRDANGNVIYVRQRVDSYGNVIVDQSRRNNYGNYSVVNSHRNVKRTYIGANGATCKYNENDKGYKEDCKYAKTNRNYKASKVKYKPTKYRPITYRPIEYHPVKYKSVKYNTPKGKGHKH